jgi:flagellar hook protein FlgE
MNCTKSCTICQIEFPATTDFFHKCSVRSKHGIKSYCKKCGNKKALERYYKNREHNLLKQKAWHYSNREKRTKQLREYSYSHRDNRNKYLAKKMKQDGQFKIRKNIRDRMRSAMQGKSKSKNTMELLGCTIEELKTHLEKQFTHGMNWDNYGKKGWHIDHILPCASFDLTDPEQQRKCFHYANLQPLWATDNYKKKDKIV